MTEKHWPVHMPNALHTNHVTRAFYHTRDNSKKIVMAWLPLVIISFIFCSLIYGVVQQTYRQSANDPQIQIAEDVASALAKGTQISSLLQSYTPINGSIDIAQSLAPFIVVYDTAKNPSGSTGLLNRNTPQLPNGVFSYLDSHDQDRITWQPQAGLRIAAVAISYHGSASGYVVVGRSLREVERREAALSRMVIIIFILLLIITFVFSYLRTTKKDF